MKLSSSESLLPPVHPENPNWRPCSFPHPWTNRPRRWDQRVAQNTKPR